MASPAEAKLPNNSSGKEEGANVDKIRDILFGSQMRDYEKRFARLEENVSKAVETLREDTMKRRAQFLGTDQAPQIAAPRRIFFHRGARFNRQACVGDAPTRHQRLGTLELFLVTIHLTRAVALSAQLLPFIIAVRWHPTYAGARDVIMTSRLRRLFRPAPAACSAWSELG